MTPPVAFFARHEIWNVVRFGAYPFTHMVRGRPVQSEFFWLFPRLTLEKSIPSKLKKDGELSGKIWDAQKEPKTKIRSTDPEIRNHNNVSLTGLQALLPESFFKPRLFQFKIVKKIMLIQKTYRRPTKIDFTLRWNENKLIDPVLLRDRFAASYRHATYETNE